MSGAAPSSISSADLLHRLIILLPASASSPPAPSLFHPRGLVNVSNRCFANAVLQCLLATPPFLAYFSSITAVLPSSSSSSSLTPVLDELSAAAPTYVELLQFLLAYRHQAVKSQAQHAEQKQGAEHKGAEDKIEVEVKEGESERNEDGADEEKSLVADLQAMGMEENTHDADVGVGSASSRRRRRRKKAAGQPDGQPDHRPGQMPIPANARPPPPSKTTEKPATHPPVPSSHPPSTVTSTSSQPPSSAVSSTSLSPGLTFTGVPFAPSFPHLLSSFQKQQVGRQEDAAELLHFLLDRLQEEATALQQHSTTNDGWSQPTTSDDWQEIGKGSRQVITRRSALLSPTPISLLCGLRLRSCLHIPQRHKDTIAWQAAFMLPLDLPSAPPLTLDASLLHYFSAQPVDSHRRGVEQSHSLDGQSLPPVLFLHLKRFASERGRLHKLPSHVSFPLSLTLPQSILHGWVSKGGALPVYELCAVAVHHGETPQSGHYTAFVRAVSEQWLSIDDTTVKVVSAATVLAQGAYLLCYSTRSDKG